MSGAGNDSFLALHSYKGNNVFNNQIVRLIVHTSVGGKQVRLRLSNEHGTTPVVIDAAHIAVSDGGPTSSRARDHVVTFGGGGAAVTTPGRRAHRQRRGVHDRPRRGNLAVSLLLAHRHRRSTTGHPNAHPVHLRLARRQRGHDRERSRCRSIATAPTFQQWPLLSGRGGARAGARTFVVARLLGGRRHSLHRGRQPPLDGLPGATLRAPRPAGGVVDAAVVANPLLHDGNGDNALARFDRDVLARPGVAYVLINDVIGVELNQGPPEGHDAA